MVQSSKVPTVTTPGAGIIAALVYAPNETETWHKNNFEKKKKKSFTELIKRNDKEFNAWAVDALLGWRNETVPANVFHIHGTHDKILPYKLVKPHYPIKCGEHMMVLSMANQISPLINKLATQRARATPFHKPVNLVIAAQRKDLFAENFEAVTFIELQRFFILFPHTQP